MLTIDTHNMDSALVEYAKRAGYREAGAGYWERTCEAAPNGHDRANAAYLNAARFESLLSEQDADVVKRAADSVKRVATLAALAAELVKHGEEEAAHRVGSEAEEETGRLNLLADRTLKRGTEGLTLNMPLEVG